MEFIDNIARKTGEPGLLAVEAAKASQAFDIGRDCGLFYAPKVVNFDKDAGLLEFERLSDLVTLLDLAICKDKRLPDLLKKAGKALAAIHRYLALPEEMKHDLPPEWMDSENDNVFIHGDFACINVCFHEPSDELVILDFSAAPMVGRTPTFGSRYFDVLLFISSIFHGASLRKAFNWNAKTMAEAFLRGYTEYMPDISLNKLKSFAPEISLLQQENILHLASQRRPLRAAGYICYHTLLNTRLNRFLQKYELPH